MVLCFSWPFPFCRYANIVTVVLYSSNPSCPRYAEDTKMVEVATQISENLQQCVETRCTDRRSKQACLGVMDCEWCVLENDGKSPLKKPFCSTQRVCFAGVLGATTPYHDEIMGKMLSIQFNCTVNLYTVLLISAEIDKHYFTQHRP